MSRIAHSRRENAFLCIDGGTHPTAFFFEIEFSDNSSALTAGAGNVVVVELGGGTWLARQWNSGASESF